jgi:hypothetical protein
MASKASTIWFWSDWLGDQEVRRLTPAERGVWIDILALAAAASPTGYVCDGKGRPLTIEEIARVTNESPEAVSNLIAGILDKGVASRDRTGRIFNRRMVRDAELRARKEELSKKRAASGHAGAAATALNYFGKQILPRQMPRHPLVIHTNKVSKKPQTSSEREKPPKEATEEEIEAIEAKGTTEFG